MASENQARNDRLARRAGFRDYREYQDALRLEAFRGYRYWLRRAAENLSASSGLDYQEAWQQVRQLDSEFHREYARVARSGFKEGPPEFDGRSMHDFLAYLGLRDETDWWGVGDTPSLT